MTKKKKALGDDPLLWIKEEGAPEDGAGNGKSAQSKTGLSEQGGGGEQDRAAAMTLDPVITISEAGKIHGALKDLLSRDEDIHIDAGNVQMIDTAGLQLLLCLSRDLKARHHRIHWISPSLPFIQSAELAGLSDWLDLP